MSPTLRLSFLIVFAMLAFAGNSLLCRIALRDTSIDAAADVFADTAAKDAAALAFMPAVIVPSIAASFTSRKGMPAKMPSPACQPS